MEPLIKSRVTAAAAYPRWDARSEAQPMAIPLGKPSDKADREEKPRPMRVAANCGVCVVALLGFVVLATTFVARLAAIRILPATRLTTDLIRGSLTLAKRFDMDQSGIRLE